jgi:hypothetical protein
MPLYIYACRITKTAGRLHYTCILIYESQSDLFSENLTTIFLVKDQLDEHFLFLICLFQFSTCFEQPSDHYHEN